MRRIAFKTYLTLSIFYFRENDNGAIKTGLLRNDLITLSKVTPQDAKNSQQFFRVEKT